MMTPVTLSPLCAGAALRLLPPSVLRSPAPAGSRGSAAALAAGRGWRTALTVLLLAVCVAVSGCGRPSPYAQGAAAAAQGAEDVMTTAGAAAESESRCNAGLAHHCTLMGQYYEHSGRSTIKAIEYYVRGCDLGDGDPRACTILEDLPPFDLSAAYDEFAHHCAAETPLPCLYQVAVLGVGQMPGPTPDQLRLADPACNLMRLGRACYLLAMGHLRGDDESGRPDTASAASYLSRACSMRDRMACARLSELYASGFNEIRQNLREAHRYAARSCYLNHAPSCMYMADIHLRGAEAVARDPRAAAEFLTKACALEDGPGCLLLGELHDRGAPGVNVAPQRAWEALSRACDLQQAEACSQVGQFYQQGRGVGQDLRAAKEYFARGCALGSHMGCERQELLQSQGI